MKKFELSSTVFPKLKPQLFYEDSAPKWLCEGGIKGSTMDNRWFWNDYILTLDIGESILTDFSQITRIE
jgi:hypothetical protein